MYHDRFQMSDLAFEGATWLQVALTSCTNPASSQRESGRLVDEHGALKT
jgi:hypothetical protein